MPCNLVEKDAKEILLVNAELGIWTNLMLIPCSWRNQTNKKLQGYDCKLTRQTRTLKEILIKSYDIRQIVPTIIILFSSLQIYSIE